MKMVSCFFTLIVIQNKLRATAENDEHFLEKSCSGKVRLKMAPIFFLNNGHID